MQFEIKCSQLKLLEFKEDPEKCSLTYNECKKLYTTLFNEIKPSKEKFKQLYNDYKETDQLSQDLYNNILESYNLFREHNYNYVQQLKYFSKKFQLNNEELNKIINNNINNNKSVSELIITKILERNIQETNSIRTNADINKNYIIENSIGKDLYDDYQWLNKSIKLEEEELHKLSTIKRSSRLNLEEYIKKIEERIKEYKELLLNSKYDIVKNYEETFKNLSTAKEDLNNIKNSIQRQREIYSELLKFISYINFTEHNKLLEQIFSKYKSYTTERLKQQTFLKETTEDDLLELIKYIPNIPLVIKKSFQYTKPKIIKYLLFKNPNLDDNIYIEQLDKFGFNQQEELKKQLEKPKENYQTIIKLLNEYYFTKIIIINNVDIYTYLNNISCRNKLGFRIECKEIKKILISLICNGFVGLLPDNTIYKDILVIQKS